MHYGYILSSFGFCIFGVFLRKGHHEFSPTIPDVQREVQGFWNF
jgi:hypothetical protein